MGVKGVFINLKHVWSIFEHKRKNWVIAGYINKNCGEHNISSISSIDG